MSAAPAGLACWRLRGDAAAYPSGVVLMPELDRHEGRQPRREGLRVRCALTTNFNLA